MSVPEFKIDRIHFGLYISSVLARYTHVHQWNVYFVSYICWIKKGNIDFVKSFYLNKWSTLRIKFQGDKISENKPAYANFLWNTGISNIEMPLHQNVLERNFSLQRQILCKCIINIYSENFEDFWQKSFLIKEIRANSEELDLPYIY